MTTELLSGSLLLTGLLAALLRAATPVLLAALGGLVSDLAGSINVALEGLMLVAAFVGVMVSAHVGLWLPHLGPVWYPWIGCLAGLLAALALTALLAVCHLEWGADLIVAGIAVNILAGGLTVFLLAALVGDKGSTAALNSPVLPSLHWPLGSTVRQWPWLDMLLNGADGRGHHVLVYVALLAAPLLAFLLKRTRYGAWLRAVGENREAAFNAGIPVRQVQYVALLISGLLAGLGGIYLSMGYLSLFQADMTAGRGFLALAAIFLGARSVAGTFWAALLFGASTVLATQLGALQMPTQLVYMVPPLVTLLALVMAGARARRRRAVTSAQSSASAEAS